MAYAIATGLRRLTAGPLTEFNSSSGVGGSLWALATVDAIGTVQGAGYISDGVAKGLNIGDIVFVQIFGGGVITDTYICAVVSVNTTTGTATLNSTTTPHIN